MEFWVFLETLSFLNGAVYECDYVANTLGSLLNCLV